MKVVSRITLAGLLAVLLLAPSLAPAATPTGKSLNRTLNAIMAEDEAPPGFALLMQRGDRVQLRQRGVSDLDTGAPFRTRQYYRIASMAKAFNGAIALGLASDGLLDLDDTLGDWIPGVLPKGDAVTIAQALQHTAGLPDYIRDDAFIDVLISDPAQYLSPLELMEFVEDTDLDFDPGTRYGYSDTDNIAVGLIAEAASGLSYDELLAKYVYAPAGLTRTSLPETVAMPSPYIHGYTANKRGGFDDDSEFINPALAWASGGIVSTLGDVNRFFRAYVGGELFGAAEQQAQQDFVNGNSSPPGPGKNNATLGLFRYETKCGTFYGHTGSFPGYRLFAAANARGTKSVVFTANAQIVPDPDGPTPPASKLMRRAQEKAICHVTR